MNRALTNRLLNEYLDGEIGLADKAELERLMAADPALRKEYQEMRRLSLLLGSQPEVIVHPYRFRQKVLHLVNAPARLILTPQRAFAGAMLVALLVISLTFSLVMYQEKLLGGWQQAPASTVAASQPGGNDLVLQIPVTAEDFFDRLLLETQLGMVDDSALAPFIAQTNVYEGATCRQSGGLRSVRFPQQLPGSLRLNVNAQQAQALHSIAVELGGERTRLAFQGANGSEAPADLVQFFAQHGSQPVRLYLEFN